MRKKTRRAHVSNTKITTTNPNSDGTDYSSVDLNIQGIAGIGEGANRRDEYSEL